LEEYVHELTITLNKLNVRIIELRRSARAQSVVAAFVTFKTGESKVNRPYPKRNLVSQLALARIHLEI
jgi:hypothetical protein